MRHLLVSAAACAVVGGGSAVADPSRRIEDFRPEVPAALIEDAHVARTQALAQEAYIWGLPAFLNYRQTTEIKSNRLLIAPEEEPFGGWVLLRKLATPATTNVMPNVDTLYGASYLLLDKQGPAVLSVPAVTDRYYSVALHDAYFNTFAVVGIRSTGGKAENVLILPPDHKGDVPTGFARVIRAPTNDIAIFQRVYIKDAADAPAVHQIQDQIKLSSLARWRDKKTGFDKIKTPEFDASAPVRDTREPLKFFEIVNKHTCNNRPADDYSALVTAFSQVKLGPCASLSADPRRQDAIRKGAQEAQLIIDAAAASRPVKNGWIIPDVTTGRASPDYLTRAVVQITQIASFSNEEAMYFVGQSDSSARPLDGANSYRVTFAPGQLPPVDPKAFWSLTMYDATTNLLVDNPINRYSVRPATPGLSKAKDGSLTIYLSHEKPAGAPEGNWLPAPKGKFIVVLRTYLPGAAILNRDWFPPPPLKIQ